MALLPRISEQEWQVMKVIWARAPRTAQEITAALSSQGYWHPNTVKTLLNRLVRKGALGYEEAGRLFQYHPLVSESDCVSEASDTFLRRVFGGSLRPMLAHFVSRKKLSRDEIGELRKMLDEAARKRTEDKSPRD